MSRGSGPSSITGSISWPSSVSASPSACGPAIPCLRPKGTLRIAWRRFPAWCRRELEAVCCQPDGNAILFVGIEEKSAPHFAFRSLPQERRAAAGGSRHYQKMMAAIEAAGRRGSTAEDLTEGHSLMADPDARELAAELHSLGGRASGPATHCFAHRLPEEQRAMAATVIGYAPDKTKVVPDLEFAMQDPDESVRANAMRALRRSQSWPRATRPGRSTSRRRGLSRCSIPSCLATALKPLRPW